MHHWGVRRLTNQPGSAPRWRGGGAEAAAERCGRLRRGFEMAHKRCAPTCALRARLRAFSCNGPLLFRVRPLQFLTPPDCFRLPVHSFLSQISYNLLLLSELVGSCISHSSVSECGHTANCAPILKFPSLAQSSAEDCSFFLPDSASVGIDIMHESSFRTHVVPKYCQPLKHTCTSGLLRLPSSGISVV
jgi:hypothetical protein